MYIFLYRVILCSDLVKIRVDLLTYLLYLTLAHFTDRHNTYVSVFFINVCLFYILSSMCIIPALSHCCRPRR